MIWVQALKSVLRYLLGRGDCAHVRVNLLHGPGFCPDCGYRVGIEWLLVHCRRCNAKRVPRKTFLGEVRPVQEFCKHCGYHDFRLVKKISIEPFELIYALMEKTTFYDESLRPGPSPMGTSFRMATAMESGDIFEAEVLRRSEYRGTKSAFDKAPFSWQTRQNPRRYGAVFNTPPPRLSNSPQVSLEN